MTSTHKNRGLTARLGFALSGLIQCYREEASFRFQMFVVVLVIITFFVLRPPLIWVALIVLISSLVLSAELFNSAMERLADAFGSMANPQIKAAKDLAAGAVLLLALTAVILGLFLLLVILQGVV